MKTATVTLSSVSPMAQSRYHGTEKLEREAAGDYEKRTWRNKMHIDKNGYVVIPALALKNCLAEAAKFMSVQIPGKGKATYTKHFEAGVLVLDNPSTGIKADDIPGQWMFLPADGKRGGGRRVEKCIPVISEWEATVEYHLLDETITPDVFEYHLRKAGQFIGLGALRVRNNGIFGRFDVADINWQEIKDAA